MRPFRFGVSGRASLADRAAWQELARTAEGTGFATLHVADHLGMPSVFPMLVSAGEVTTTLRLGSLVLNNDFHHPVRLAQEVATADLLLDGRLELGLGSGWSAPEYEVLDLSYDGAPARTARLRAALGRMRAVWAGEVTYEYRGETQPAAPPPRQRPHPPILIGGHGDAVLTLAAEEADIVGLTGLVWRGGQLVPAGAAWPVVAERAGFVRSRAGERAGRIELHALAQVVAVTDDAAGTIAPLATRFGREPAELLASPFVLVGSRAALVEKLLAMREQLGISYVSVFEEHLHVLEPVVAALTGVSSG